MRNTPPLPIDAVLPELVAALRAAGAAVLRAATGAGKTTRVPSAILDSGLAGTGETIVLEPRRVAARAAAARVAYERGMELGGEVGYQVRHERRAGRNTRIRFVTEGVFLRQLQADPLLEGVGAVVFDEFHERSLDSDLALALVRQTRREVRPDLKLVVMSATLAVAGLAEYLGGCPVLESAGRTFPVDVVYRPRAAGATLSTGPNRGGLLSVPAGETADAVRWLLDRTPGDVLVFLPGLGEIRQVERELSDLVREGILVRPLYGDLPLEEQAAAIQKQARRRIVLATNVAETSLTVEGVTGVVDTGLARESRLDPQLGLNRLDVVRISQASAEQRAGRAGRTAPGICVRLWGEREQALAPAFTLPEIRRVELSQVLLQLYAWGETDPRAFGWLEAPPAETLLQAERLLENLGAWDGRRLTSRGRTLARLPLAPRLAAMVVEGWNLGCVDAACLAAALVGERDPFVRRPGPRTWNTAAHRGGRWVGSGPPPGAGAGGRISDSDLLDRVMAIEQWADGESGGGGNRGRRGSFMTDVGELNVPAARLVLQAAAQSAREVEQLLGAPPEPSVDPEEAVLRAAWAGYADRLVRRRSQRGKGKMQGGRGVALAPGCAVTEAELFVAIEVEAGPGEDLVRSASAVERDWLDPASLRTEVEAEFDAEREKLVGRRRTYYRDLLLDEVPADLPPGKDSAAALVEAARRNLSKVLPRDDKAWERFLARARSLAAWRPELNLPNLDDAQLETLLVELARGKRSFAELRSAGWLDWARNLFTQEQLQTLEREAPERIVVPSGRAVTLEYVPGEPPVLAARIQHLFGLKETPRVAGGRVAVLVHLLAPNGRPQQITQDLPSFWKTTYHEVRKELRRRYPKHAWPEDPWSAIKDE